MLVHIVSTKGFQMIIWSINLMSCVAYYLVPNGRPKTIILVHDYIFRSLTFVFIPCRAQIKSSVWIFLLLTVSKKCSSKLFLESLVLFFVICPDVNIKFVILISTNVVVPSKQSLNGNVRSSDWHWKSQFGDYKGKYVLVNKIMG